MKEQDIVQFITEYKNIDLDQIKTKTREWDIVYVRHLLMYSLKSYTKMSFKSIGRMFDQDHTTVMNGVRRISTQMIDDDKIAEDVKAIEHHFLIEQPKGDELWRAYVDAKKEIRSLKLKVSQYEARLSRVNSFLDHLKTA